MDSPEHDGSSSSPSVNPYVLSVKWGTAESAVQVELSDGSSFFILPADYDSAVYAQGREVYDEDLQLLTLLDERCRAYRKAVELLTRREHSSHELSTKLQQRDFGRSTVREVCDLLADQGYLNDRRFAELFVRIRLQRKPEGRIRIEQRLRSKGVSPAVCGEVLDAFFTEELLTELLGRGLETVRRKRGELGREELVRELQKLGFRYAEIGRYLEF